MGNWHNFSLILLIAYDVSGVSLIGKGNVIELYKAIPGEGVENSAKCHVRGTWEGQDDYKYKLICYQCNDLQRYFVIYHGKRIIQTGSVGSCKHFDVTGSITVVPAYLVDHKIEYDTRGGACSQIMYYERFIKVSDCGKMEDRYLAPTRWLYYNGWKHLVKPWTTGVVRGITSADYETGFCTAKGQWKYAYLQITMVCYDCGTEYIAKVYSDGISVTSAAVGTCRSDDLVTSIDIILPSYSRSTVIGVQYKYYYDQCVYKTYTNKGNGRVIANKEICVRVNLKKVPSLRRYKNGWLQYLRIKYVTSVLHEELANFQFAISYNIICVRCSTTWKRKW